MKAMVFSGLYPIDPTKFEDLREALDKLKLNDSALSYEPETSKALGFGFRTGFLGLLHMEIVEERIRREFNIDLIATSPSVVYEVVLNDGTIQEVDAPYKMPKTESIKKTREPFVKASIFSPSEYIGDIMKLCQDKRGEFINMDYIDTTRVQIDYKLPLSEMVFDFFDRLKSIRQLTGAEADLNQYKSNYINLGYYNVFIGYCQVSITMYLKVFWCRINSLNNLKKLK